MILQKYKSLCMQASRGRNRSGRSARRGRRGGHQGPNRQELAIRARQERQIHIEVYTY